MWNSLAMRVRHHLEELHHVIHVIQVCDDVVDGADDFHDVRLERFAEAQLGDRR